MKKYLFFFVKFYWKFKPECGKDRCIFKECCSDHIYKALTQEGVRAFFKACYYRHKTCRPGYSLLHNPMNGKVNMVLANDEIIGQDKIAERLIISYCRD